MEMIRSYENFPFRLVAAAVMLSVSIYAVGAFILAGFGNIMLTLSLYGNYLVRSRFACACCEQRELGCRAEQFFSKRQA